MLLGVLISINYHICQIIFQFLIQLILLIYGNFKIIYG